MQTYFLKFADEAEAIQNLAAFRNEDQWLTYKDGANLDVVGTIYKPTGVTLTDAEGMQYPEMAPLSGFHVNILSDGFDEALAAFVVYPASPSRVWA